MTCAQPCEVRYGTVAVIMVKIFSPGVLSLNYTSRTEGQLPIGVAEDFPIDASHIKCSVPNRVVPGVHGWVHRYLTSLTKHTSALWSSTLQQYE